MKFKMYSEEGGADTAIEYCCNRLKKGPSFNIDKPYCHIYQATYLTALFLGMENIEHTEENLRVFLNLHRKDI